MNSSVSTVSFLYGHWNVSWRPHGAEHTVWLQDITAGDTWTIMHPGACSFHLTLPLYFSQMKSPSQGLLLGQAGPAPNWIHTLTEVRVSLLLSLELSLVTCCCQKRLVKASWGGLTKLMTRSKCLNVLLCFKKTKRSSHMLNLKHPWYCLPGDGMWYKSHKCFWFSLLQFAPPFSQNI